MKFNTKTRYGLRTMIEIAIHRGGGGVLQKEISERQEISFKYLDAIIASLKASGLIVNAAGRMSGYILARKPENISVYDIYKAFEQELLVADCLAEGSVNQQDSQRSAMEFWHELNDDIIRKLQSRKLSNLAKRQMEINEAKVENMFYI